MIASGRERRLQGIEAVVHGSSAGLRNATTMVSSLRTVDEVSFGPIGMVGVAFAPTPWLAWQAYYGI
jgi:hypothetical protein